MTPPIAPTPRRSLFTPSEPPIPGITPTATTATRPSVPGASDTFEVGAAGAKPAVDARTPAQKRLDAFRDKYTPEYQVDGAKVKSTTPFRMNGGDNQNATEAEMKVADAAGIVRGPQPTVASKRMTNDLVAAKKWDGAMGDATVRAAMGRGTPDDVKRVTQALIDAGKLPPATQVGPDGAITRRPDGERIREMQWRYGIGVDCAGYVSQASPASQGKTTRPPGGMFAPAAPHYDRVRAPMTPDGLDVKPGDVVTLGDPTGDVGHSVTVYDKRKLAGDELGAATRADRGGFLSGTKGVTVYEVDSSWGAGGKPSVGGVQRRTWLYNADTKRWANYDPSYSPAIRPTPAGPYDHTVGTVYRPR